MSRNSVFIFAWLSIIVPVLSGFSQEIDSTQAQREAARSDTNIVHKKSPTGAMLRSLVFPGWGQWYNNKKIKAIVFFCGETALLTNAIYLNQQLVNSEDLATREFYINNRNLSVWWLVGVVLFSMGDAFVDAHLADFDESPSLTISPVQIQGAGQKDVFAISVCFRW